MKKLFFCAAALLAAISFAACSDDEESNLPITPDTIAGTWQIIHAQWWYTLDGKKETGSKNYPNVEGFYWTLTFDKNESCVQTEYEDGGVYSTHYTYSISGNKLALTDEYETEEYKIKTLTESRLVLVYTYKDEEGVEERTLTYKRIK